MQRELVDQRVVQHKDHEDRLEYLIEVQRDCVRIEHVLVEVRLVLLEGVQTHLQAIQGVLRCWVRCLRCVLCDLPLEYRNLSLDVL